MENQLNEIVEKFKSKKVLVIGDLILDAYLFGSSTRISREAPVPVVDLRKIRYVAGGAGNCAINAASLGAEVRFLSVIGEDKEGRLLKKIIKSFNINPAFIISSPKRQTLCKKRIICNGQISLRYDYGSTEEIDRKTEKQTIATINNYFSSFDLIIISDYGYGFVTDKVIDEMSKLQNQYKKVIIADAKNLYRLRKMCLTAIKPNFDEALRITDQKINEKKPRIKEALRLGPKIFNNFNAKFVAITVDCEGSVIFQKDMEPIRKSVIKAKNSMSIGAGDTYTAALGLSLTSGASAPEAAEIASGAASIVVKKEGTAYCSSHDLSSYFNPQKKIIYSVLNLTYIRKSLKSKNKTVVFTNGCFDILHSGHTTYLHEAKKLGDILIVGINTDESIRRIKGGSRPINNLIDRMKVLSSLSSVDLIIPFNEDTPINLITTIKPDIFVKGGDYKKDILPETKIVEENNGTVIILPYIPHHSTSLIIDKITNGHSGKKFL